MDIFDLAFGGIGAKERLQKLGPIMGGAVLQVGHCPNLSRNEIPRRHSSLFPVQNRRFSVTESDTNPPSHIYGGCHEGISGFIRFSRLEEVHVTRWRHHEPNKKHIVYL